MIKGITQHIIPYENGWAVYEDWNPDTLLFFSTQEAALAHAQERARLFEAPLLVHSAIKRQETPVTLHLAAGISPR
jgi:hypothetical protein